MLRETAFANRNNRRDVPDIALLFTDGNSMDIEETIREAYLCKQAGIHIIVVAVSDWINTDELDTVASYPSTVNRFLLDSYDRLNDIVEEIRDLICNSEYEISKYILYTIIVVHRRREHAKNSRGMKFV